MLQTDNKTLYFLGKLTFSSHLPLSSRDRQSTLEIFSVITFSFGDTSTTSFVQLRSFCNDYKLSLVEHFVWHWQSN